jgi:hypothetical protein
MDGGTKKSEHILKKYFKRPRELMKGEPILQKSSKRLGNPRKRSAYL